MIQILALRKRLLRSAEAAGLLAQHADRIGEMQQQRRSSRFVRPSNPGISKGSEFILTEQMYFGADAAIVNAYLYLSGKNMDAFLRKRDGRWQVTQGSLWEN